MTYINNEQLIKWIEGLGEKTVELEDARNGEKKISKKLNETISELIGYVKSSHYLLGEEEATEK